MPALDEDRKGLTRRVVPRPHHHLTPGNSLGCLGIVLHLLLSGVNRLVLTQRESVMRFAGLAESTWPRHKRLSETFCEPSEAM